MSKEETAIRWLRNQAQTSRAHERTVSGEGEAAEIYETILSMLKRPACDVLTEQERIELTALATTCRHPALMKLLDATSPDGTPAAHWREDGKDDPHGIRYDCPRNRLCGGHMTDDEVANAMFLDPSIMNLTVAKDRIRWLSRRLVERETRGATPEQCKEAIELEKALCTALGRQWSPDPCAQSVVTLARDLAKTVRPQSSTRYKRYSDGLPAKDSRVEWISPDGDVVRGTFCGGAIWFPEGSKTYIYYTPSFWRQI